MLSNTSASSKKIITFFINDNKIAKTLNEFFWNTVKTYASQSNPASDKHNDHTLKFTSAKKLFFVIK